MKEYRSGKNVFNIVCNVDNIVLIAENENDLWLVYNFNKASHKYNMKIAEQKTKSNTISHKPIKI